MTNRRLGCLWLAGFIATILAANVLIERFGVVSVGFGLTAPAGVYAAGLAFCLRDMVHDTLGRRWVLVAIAAGALLSWAISDGVTLPGGLVPLALASGIAFGLSELCDFAVYAPLRERRWTLAVLLSGIVGAVVDSIIFLMLAFNSLAFLPGQVWGKVLMVGLAALVLSMTRRGFAWKLSQR